MICLTFCQVIWGFTIIMDTCYIFFLSFFSSFLLPNNNLKQCAQEQCVQNRAIRFIMSYVILWNSHSLFDPLREALVGLCNAVRCGVLLSLLSHMIVIHQSPVSQRERNSCAIPINCHLWNGKHKNQTHSIEGVNLISHKTEGKGVITQECKCEKTRAAI